jgi:hypothetical protein
MTRSVYEQWFLESKHPISFPAIQTLPRTSPLHLHISTKPAPSIQRSYTISQYSLTASGQIITAACFGVSHHVQISNALPYPATHSFDYTEFVSHHMPCRVMHRHSSHLHTQQVAQAYLGNVVAYEFVVIQVRTRDIGLTWVFGSIGLGASQSIPSQSS